MKVSLSWLREYVPIQMELDDLCEALTMAGLEVDAVTDRYAFLETVLVGKVVEVMPHPNADRLKCCRVDHGDGVVQVVCGAPNVTAGMNAPLAMIGTRLPNGMEVEKSVIRKMTSEGMLCSETELELGTDGSGLMVLDRGLQPGTPLTQALGLSDATIEIDLTPNRPDCLSLLGVAREIAAIAGVTMNRPKIQLPEAKGSIADVSSVTIEAPDHCPRYAARLVTQVTVAPSPFWLQDRLRSVGIRPINNLVDVTNFVMMETGQPLHAFDFDHLAENRIVVRTATEKEAFTTLDQKDRRLSDHMLMICDGEKPVAVGGVMGGLNSEIEDTTTRVLIESACFDPISVRKTAKALGLGTDASHRFERGVDPDGTLYALDRAAALMTELGKGALIDGVIDEDFRTTAPPELSLSATATNHQLGTDLDRNHMADLLESVGFETRQEKEDAIIVRVPSFRVDVTRPCDLVEEVARLYGYNRIPTTFPTLPAQGTALLPAMMFRNRVREILSGFGFSEAINYSFIGADSCDRLRLASEDPRRNHVTLLNPISEEQSVMRTSLIPGMLETAQRNISRQQNNLRLFEIGKAFLPQPEELLPVEKEVLVGLLTGLREKPNWHTKDATCDFYDAKGMVEALVNALGITGLSFTALPDEDCRYTRIGHTAQIRLAGRSLGIVGELDAAVMKSYDIRQNTFIVEMDLTVLGDRLPNAKRMVPIPRYPATSRDVTVIIDQEVESGRLLEKVAQFKEALVKEIFLFDLFSGDPVPAGKKSVSFRVVYQSEEQTLEDDAVNAIHGRLTHRLIDEFGASLPV